MTQVDQVEVPARVRTPKPNPDRPEIVEVEVERISAPSEVERASQRAHPPRAGLFSRVWNALAPVVLGMLIDAGDVATPFITFPFSILAGMVAGYLFSGFLRVPPTWRMVITGLTGVYWAAPFTGAVPLATATMLVVQIVRPEGLKDEPFG